MATKTISHEKQEFGKLGTGRNIESNTFSHPTQTKMVEPIVERLRSHDAQAFASIYDDYGAALFGVARKILNDEILAEDAIQEAFVRIWRKIDSYDETKGRFFTWMLNITRNICIDMLRSKAGKKDAATSSLEPGKMDYSGPQTSQNPDHIGLRDLVEKLPGDQKLIIDLLYFQGYTQSEVSDEFNIPLGTVKSRVRLAMNQLRLVIQ